MPRSTLQPGPARPRCAPGHEQRHAGGAEARGWRYWRPWKHRDARPLTSHRAPERTEPPCACVARAGSQQSATPKKGRRARRRAPYSPQRRRAPLAQHVGSARSPESPTRRRTRGASPTRRCSMARALNTPWSATASYALAPPHPGAMGNLVGVERERRGQAWRAEWGGGIPPSSPNPTMRAPGGPQPLPVVRGTFQCGMGCRMGLFGSWNEAGSFHAQAPAYSPPPPGAPFWHHM